MDDEGEASGGEDRGACAPLAAAACDGTVCFTGVRSSSDGDAAASAEATAAVDPAAASAAPFAGGAIASFDGVLRGVSRIRLTLAAGGDGDAFVASGAGEDEGGRAALMMMRACESCARGCCVTRVQGARRWEQWLHWSALTCGRELSLIPSHSNCGCTTVPSFALFFEFRHAHATGHSLKCQSGAASMRRS